MNYNIISYSIYLSISVYIIFWLGNFFHSKGKVFILALFKQQTSTTNATNNMLLVLYYLFNIGYAIIQLSIWPVVTNYHLLFGLLVYKISIQLLLLAILHYLNMLGIYAYASFKINNISSL